VGTWTLRALLHHSPSGDLFVTSPRRLAVLAATVVSGLAAAAPAQAAAPGLNVSDYGDAQTALDKGAKQVRFFVRWSDFEPESAADFTPRGQASRTPIPSALEANVDKVLKAGVTPIMVVLGSPAWAASGKRPRNPDEYAAFIGELAEWLAAKRRAGQPSPVYEVWNEPDALEFWGEAPNPDFYTVMLKASYAKVKAGDPGATVLTGPTTGNNFAWIESLYARGAKGSFDGVSVHTDIACSVVGPDTFYREPSGRLGQFTFLGYREVRASMLANGDDKPIWMTELGWSTTDGGPTSCVRGESAGRKPSGVDETNQAAFLTRAYQCLANDPYVIAAAWFTLRDVQGQPLSSELGNYGLLRRDGSAKPALGAFGGPAGQGAGACGDFAPPTLDVLAPTEGQQFVDKLDLRAAATDGGVGLARITYAYDGAQEIRNFTDALANGSAVGLAPWQNSGKLGLGAHTIHVTALDKNGNTVQRVVKVTMVAPGKLAGSLVPVFRLGRKTSCTKGRAATACSLKGSLSTGAPGRPSIGGKVAVEWQWKNKQRKFRKLVGGLKPASKGFTFSAKLKKKGTWRVRVVYNGVAPYRRATSKYLTFRVR